MDDWFACWGALYIASMIPHRLTLDDNRNWSSVSSKVHCLLLGVVQLGTGGMWSHFNDWLAYKVVPESS